MTDAQQPLIFTGAIDESTDPRHLPPGTLVSATNGVFDQDGQLSVRYGYTMLSSPPSSVFKLATFGLELVVFTLLGACYSHAPGASEFVGIDTTTSIGVTHAPLSNSTTNYTSWGIVDVNGFRIVGYIDAVDNFPRATVYDQTTGAQILATTLSSTQAVNVYIGAIGNTVILTVADLGGGSIRGYTLNTSPLGAWSAGTVLSDGNFTSSSGVYATAYSASLVVVSYEHLGGGSSTLEVRAFNSALSNQYSRSNSLTAGTNTFDGMGARITDGEQYWVVFHTFVTGYANKVVAVLMTPSTGAATASFSVGFDTGGSGCIQIGLERLSSTQQALTVTEGTDTWSLQITSAGVVAASTVHAFNIRTMSAPIFVSSLSTTVQLWADDSEASGGSPGGAYYLVDLLTSTPGTYPRLIAIIAPGIAGVGLQPSGEPQFPSTAWTVNASGQLETVVPILETVSGRQGIELITADPTSAAKFRYSPDVLGKEAYFSGYRYDSRLLVEHGFAQQPTFTLSNVAGTGHTRQYAVTYGWIDDHGNFEESGPAAIASVVSGATPNTNVVIRTTGISRKHRSPQPIGAGKIVVIVYRTQDLASGDTTLYRVTKEPFTVLNDPTSANVTFADTTSDSDLTDGTHPVLYTVSGELAHSTPETFTDITSHMDRVWGIGADQRTIWYSQQYVDGSIPAWSVFSQTSVDDAGEPLTAIADLYDKLLIFTKTKIYVVYGSGPSPAGTGNDLTTPQRIPSPSGCIDPRSIVETQQGVFFQSERGIELVGPDLSVNFVGQPIAITTANFPIVTSAVMVEQNSVIRFTLVNTETPGVLQGGRVIQYDIRRGRWMVHQLTNGGGKGAAAAAPQSAVAHPTLGYVEGHNDNPLAGIIARENTAADATPWLDYGATFVNLTWTTGWIKANDLQGWGSIRRIRILGNYYDNHALTFTLFFDYKATGESHNFSDTTLFTTFLSGAPYEQLMIHPGPSRRCQAIQIQGSSVAPSVEPANGGRGAGFVGLAFETRPQKGGFRNVPTAARG